MEGFFFFVDKINGKLVSNQIDINGGLHVLWKLFGPLDLWLMIMMIIENGHMIPAIIAHFMI